MLSWTSRRRSPSTTYSRSIISRMCSTSWSVSCDTRRSAGRLSFSMISPAFVWPIPWIYCSAITTRLLVGRLTPAIRATLLAPVCRTMPAVSPLPVSGENAKCHDDTRPSARAGIGAAVMQNGCRVLKDSKSFRQPLLVTELTAFCALFRSLPGCLRRRRFLGGINPAPPRFGCSGTHLGGLVGRGLGLFRGGGWLCRFLVYFLLSSGFC